MTIARQDNGRAGRASAFATRAIGSKAGAAFFLAAPFVAILATMPWLFPLASPPLAAYHGSLAVFGYAGAVVAGFLLTAVPRWTSSAPPGRAFVLVLLSGWIAGRFADLGAAPGIRILLVAADLAFTVALFGWAGARIVAAGAWKTLRVLACVAVYGFGRTVTLAPPILGLDHDTGMRLAVGGLVLMMIVVGGRIVPGFTRKHLIERGVPKLPVWFSGFDVVVLATGVAALTLWIAMPFHAATAYAFGVAGLLQFGRVARWRGLAVVREPDLLVHHVGYAFIALGFLAGSFVSPSAAVHVWMLGTLGVLGMAIMARAVGANILGRACERDGLPVAAAGLAAVAALARAAAAMFPGEPALAALAGTSWIGAQVAFLAALGPALLCALIVPETATPSASQAGTRQGG